MLTSRICRLHFETEKVLGTDFVLCDMKDVTIPHALCIEKNIVYYVISFREGWYGFRKPQCGDPEHRITLCEMNSIKSDNISGYIINVNYDTFAGYRFENICKRSGKRVTGCWKCLHTGLYPWIFSLLSKVTSFLIQISSLEKWLNCMLIIFTLSMNKNHKGYLNIVMFCNLVVL